MPRSPGPPPWERTEVREPCEDFDILRKPLFGDLHVHTLYSADAYIFGTRVDPRGAYAFARGEEITASDENEEQTRVARIDRPLDFAAVTDHSEFIGEVSYCHRPDSPLYDHPMCVMLRRLDTPENEFETTVNWLFPAGIDNPPSSHAFCFMPGIDCDAEAMSVWNVMKAAAEEAYDRSSRCGFTTFIGYEHTASPLGKHLHRNVIFRNDHVPPVPASQLETAALGVPQGVWWAIETGCLNAGEGCDAVIIPHNSNLSGGQQWMDPADAAEAQRRQNLEPLVEIHQHKGNSECRFDRLTARGVGTEDELCTFEQLLRPDETPGTPVTLIDGYPRRNLVRNTLKDGLALEQQLGVNPFRLGFIGSTDTHNASAGDTAENGWDGYQGREDSTPAKLIADKLHENPGGLAAVWAEESSRDAIFSALKRRETYATSGSRLTVRFFAGDLDDVACDSPDFVEQAYASGVPMGAEIGPVRGAASPRFAVLASKDPGTAETPGADLARVQIVKGWVDASGETHERVFDVTRAGDDGLGVDPDTCVASGGGAATLCSVWEDPEFDQTQRAFYYTRVLERPTCRWTTIVCKREGVDPFAPDCVAQAASAGESFADCCLAKEEDPFFSPVVQERAWSSPIWYEPESIASLDGRIAMSSVPGRGTLALELRLGALPPDVDPASAALELTITDDDEVYRSTTGTGLVQSASKAGQFHGTGRGTENESLSLSMLESGDALVRLETGEIDLARADMTDHMVTVSLALGGHRTSTTRLWRASGGLLESGPQ